MPTIELRDVSNYTLYNVNLKVQNKELMVLLGPTGAGKTTLLNVVAGLVPYEGKVIFDGTRVDNVPTEERQIGYLFQNLALFPHLTVTSNVAYGLKAKNVDSDQVEFRVEELLDFMGIKHLKDRYTGNLSGGERQRVALARALANKPRILLLDEPFNSLDPTTSKHLRIEFRRLQKELGITSIFVTHNLLEAEEMSDRVAVMCDGEIQQIAAPRELFSSPRNEKVSNFIGTPNILECEYFRTLETGLAEVGCRGIPIIIPYDGGKIDKIAISPKDIFVSKEEIPGPRLNSYKGTIKEAEQFGSLIKLRVEVKGRVLLTELPKDAYEYMNLSVGEEVFLKFSMRSIRTF
jgi:ABC-type Fe3+/spermidine/putrescine transport system ATPase subunit